MGAANQPHRRQPRATFESCVQSSSSSSAAAAATMCTANDFLLSLYWSVAPASDATSSSSSKVEVVTQCQLKEAQHAVIDKFNDDETSAKCRAEALLIQTLRSTESSESPPSPPTSPNTQQQTTAAKIKVSLPFIHRPRHRSASERRLHAPPKPPRGIPASPSFSFATFKSASSSSSSSSIPSKSTASSSSSDEKREEKEDDDDAIPYIDEGDDVQVVPDADADDEDLMSSFAPLASSAVDLAATTAAAAVTDATANTPLQRPFWRKWFSLLRSKKRETATKEKDTTGGGSGPDSSHNPLLSISTTTTSTSSSSSSLQSSSSSASTAGNKAKAPHRLFSSLC